MAPTITLLPSGQTVLVDEHTNIVDGLRSGGLRTPYKCRRGGCGSCKVRLVSGGVRYPVPIADSVLSAEEQALGLCLPCRAVPTSDVVLDVGEARVRTVLASPPASRATCLEQESE